MPHLLYTFPEAFWRKSGKFFSAGSFLLSLPLVTFAVCHALNMDAENLNAAQIYALSRVYGDRTHEIDIDQGDRDSIESGIKIILSSIEARRERARLNQAEQDYRIFSIEDGSGRENMFDEDGELAAFGRGYESEERETAFYEETLALALRTMSESNPTERGIANLITALDMLSARADITESLIDSSRYSESSKKSALMLAESAESAKERLLEKASSMPYVLSYMAMIASGLSDMLYQAEGRKTPSGEKDPTLSKVLKSDESTWSDSLFANSAEGVSLRISELRESRSREAKRVLTLLIGCLHAIESDKREESPSEYIDAANRDEALALRKRLSSSDYIRERGSKEPERALFESLGDVKDLSGEVYESLKDISNISPFPSIYRAMEDYQSIRDPYFALQEDSRRFMNAAGSEALGDSAQGTEAKERFLKRALDSLGKYREGFLSGVENTPSFVLENEIREDLSKMLSEVSSKGKDALREIEEAIDGPVLSEIALYRIQKAMKSAEWAITESGNEGLKEAYALSHGYYDDSAGDAWEAAKEAYEEGRPLPESEFAESLFGSDEERLRFREGILRGALSDLGENALRYASWRIIENLRDMSFEDGRIKSSLREMGLQDDFIESSFGELSDENSDVLMKRYLKRGDIPYIREARMLWTLDREERESLLNSLENLRKESSNETEKRLDGLFSLIQKRDDLLNEKREKSDPLLSLIRENSKSIIRRSRENGERYPEIKRVPSALLASFFDFESSIVPGLAKSKRIFGRDSSLRVHDTSGREMSDEMLFLSLSMAARDEGSSDIFDDVGVPESWKSAYDGKDASPLFQNEREYLREVNESADSDSSLMDIKKRLDGELSGFGSRKLTKEEVKNIRDSAQSIMKERRHPRPLSFSKTEFQKVVDAVRESPDDSSPILSRRFIRTPNGFQYSESGVPLRELLSRIPEDEYRPSSKEIERLLMPLIHSESKSEIRAGIKMAGILLRGLEGKTVRLPLLFSPFQRGIDTKSYLGVLSFEEASRRGYSAMENEKELSKEELDAFESNPGGWIWSRDRIRKDSDISALNEEVDILNANDYGFKPQKLFSDMEKGYPVFRVTGEEDLRAIGDFVSSYSAPLLLMSKGTEKMQKGLKEWMDSTKVLVLFPKSSIGGSATAGMRMISLSDLADSGTGTMTGGEDRTPLLSSGDFKAAYTANFENPDEMAEAASKIRDKGIKWSIILEEALREAGANVIHEDPSEAIQEPDREGFPQLCLRYERRTGDIAGLRGFERIRDNDGHSIEIADSGIRNASSSGYRGVRNPLMASSRPLQADSYSAIPRTWSDSASLDFIKSVWKARSGGTGDEAISERGLFASLSSPSAQEALRRSGIPGDPALRRAALKASSIEMDIREALSDQALKSDREELLRRLNIKGGSKDEENRLLKERFMEIESGVRLSMSRDPDEIERARGIFQSNSIEIERPDYRDFLNIVGKLREHGERIADSADIKKMENRALLMKKAIEDYGLSGSGFDDVYTVLFRAGLVSDHKMRESLLRRIERDSETLGEKEASYRYLPEHLRRGLIGRDAKSLLEREKDGINIRNVVSFLKLEDVKGSFWYETSSNKETGSLRISILKSARTENEALMRRELRENALETGILGVIRWVPSEFEIDKDGKPIMSGALPLLSKRDTERFESILKTVRDAISPDVDLDKELQSYPYSQSDGYRVGVRALKRAQREARSDLSALGWRKSDAKDASKRLYSEIGEGRISLFWGLSEKEAESAIEKELSKPKGPDEASKETELLSMLSNSADIDRSIQNWTMSILSGADDRESAFDILRETGLRDILDKTLLKQRLDAELQGKPLHEYRESMKIGAERMVDRVSEALLSYSLFASKSIDDVKAYRDEAAKDIGRWIEKATGKKADAMSIIRNAMLSQKLDYQSERLKTALRALGEQKGELSAKSPKEKPLAAIPRLSYTASVLMPWDVQSALYKAIASEFSEDQAFNLRKSGIGSIGGDPSEFEALREAVYSAAKDMLPGAEAELDSLLRTRQILESSGSNLRLQRELMLFREADRVFGEYLNGRASREDVLDIFGDFFSLQNKMVPPELDDLLNCRDQIREERLRAQSELGERGEFPTEEEAPLLYEYSSLFPHERGTDESILLRGASFGADGVLGEIASSGREDGTSPYLSKTEELIESLTLRVAHLNLIESSLEDLDTARLLMLPPESWTPETERERELYRIIQSENERAIQREREDRIRELSSIYREEGKANFEKLSPTLPDRLFKGAAGKESREISLSRPIEAKTLEVRGAIIPKPPAFHRLRHEEPVVITMRGKAYEDALKRWKELKISPIYTEGSSQKTTIIAREDSIRALEAIEGISVSSIAIGDKAVSYALTNMSGKIERTTEAKKEPRPSRIRSQRGIERV